MNLKCKRHSDIVHVNPLDFQELMLEQEGNRHQRMNYTRSNWALCGASGSRKLIPTKETANCRGCLSILRKMQLGIWIGDNGTRCLSEKLEASKHCYKNKRGQYSLLKSLYPKGQVSPPHWRTRNVD